MSELEELKQSIKEIADSIGADSLSADELIKKSLLKALRPKIVCELTAKHIEDIKNSKIWSSEISTSSKLYVVGLSDVLRILGVDYE